MTGQAEQQTWLSAERAAFVMLLLLAVVLTGMWWLRGGTWRNEMVVADSQPDYLDRIDPNTAPWQTLACLPGIGEQRARQIVSYRQQRPRPAFTQPDDLLGIRGIGPKTVETLRPLLTFPQTQPEVAAPCLNTDPRSTNTPPRS